MNIGERVKFVSPETDKEVTGTITDCPKGEKRLDEEVTVTVRGDDGETHVWNPWYTKWRLIDTHYQN